MSKLNPQIKKQVEEAAGDKMTDNERERFFDEIFDMALACDPPADQDDRDHIVTMLQALVEEMAIHDAMVIAFDLGRVYQYRKGEPPQISSEPQDET